MAMSEESAAKALTVSPAMPAERDAVVALWTRAGLVAPYNDPVQDFDFASGRAGSDVLLGRIGDEVVASVMVGHDGHRGWLYYVAVDPVHRRLGHGAAIVAAAEAWLAARGVRKAMLLVRESNAGVAGFYEELGYAPAPRTIFQKWISPVAETPPGA